MSRVRSLDTFILFCYLGLLSLKREFNSQCVPSVLSLILFYSLRLFLKRLDNDSFGSCGSVLKSTFEYDSFGSLVSFDSFRLVPSH